MSSPVDICNLALSMLGDAATVSSIDPPDQSAQAGHCARFYPIARDALLEMHAWGFATRRVALAAAPSNPSSTWQYAYLSPAAVVNYLSILDPNANDDYSAGLQAVGTYTPQIGLGNYTPQAYQVETLSDGTGVILTNQQNAVLRYTTIVTDTTQFSPLFVEGLSIFLASKLAGPLLKGAEGRAAAAQLTGMFLKWKEFATESDSNQRKSTALHSPTWMVNR